MRTMAAASSKVSRKSSKTAQRSDRQQKGEQLQTVAVLSVAVILRVLLWWANPPANSFDNHFEPIFLIMQSGSIPAKDACFQCYHPPVFYWISAAVGNFAVHAGATIPHVVKLLQFLPCLYGILTVGVCYLILRKIRLTPLSRVIALGTASLLPRHIYMSAMNSNDTISYLCVAVSIYVAILAIERKFSPVSLAALSIVLTVAIFTKYTAFAVIPMVAVALGVACRNRVIGSRKRLIASLVGAFALPMLLLAAYMFNNMARYHSPLPWNVAIYDPSVHRPRDKERISFLTFKPWEDVQIPILAPGKLHSFWTLMYSGMWFDTEPYFIRFLDSNQRWWEHYYRWYRGTDSFPSEPLPLSRFTMLEASGAITLGLLPLTLTLIGIGYSLGSKSRAFANPEPAERTIMIMFPVLLAFNVAGAIALTLRLPVYNAMKPSYLLNSTPALMVFLAVGVALIEKNTQLKRIVLLSFAALFVLVIVHVLHIVFAIR
jgi:4-amino-4-deoxy-L-arabinose transferase-like glycosyltransferase